MTTFMLHGYRAGRDEPFPAHAARVWATLSALTALSPRLGPWWRRDDAGRAEPVDDLVAAAGALGASAVSWWRAGREATSWAPVFCAGDAHAPWAECAFTVGVSLPALPGVFAPERVSLRLDLADDDVLARPEAVGAVLAALGVAMELSHAHAGGARVPAPRLPLLSDGAPVAGWMTLLGPREAPLPAVLPAPLVARPLPGGATLVTAVSEVFRERDPGHRAAVEALARALDARPPRRPPA